MDDKTKARKNLSRKKTQNYWVLSKESHYIINPFFFDLIHESIASQQDRSAIGTPVC